MRLAAHLSLERDRAHLGLEVLRVRLDGMHAGQDGVGARCYQLVTLPPVTVNLLNGIA